MTGYFGGAPKAAYEGPDSANPFALRHYDPDRVALGKRMGVFGSVDMNRNDDQPGWDTDQFPNNAGELSLAVWRILKGGGFTTGGMNFDAKLRRQSIDAEDPVLAHIGGMDVAAHALKIAAAMIEDGGLETALAARYAGWRAEEGLLGGDLEAIAARVAAEGIEPQPRSGKQEAPEKYVNRFV